MNPVGRNGGNAWTWEEIHEMSRLVSEGLSAGQIARVMGTHTRNSIIGKIHRLGLQLKRLPTQSNVARPRLPNPRFRGIGRGVDPIAPTPPVLHIVPAECVPMLLIDTGSSNCRFPMWDNVCPQEPTVCGGRTATFGGSWCDHHLRVIHGQRQPVKAREAA